MMGDLQFGDEMGRKDDPMNEVWASPTWRPLDQQWDDNNDEGVTVIPADEAIQYSKREPEPSPDTRVATLRHLPNADDLHEQRIAALTTAIQTAIDFLTLPKTGAKAWANDLRYGKNVIDHIEDAADSLVSALRLIDTNEQG